MNVKSSIVSTTGALLGALLINVGCGGGSSSTASTSTAATSGTYDKALAFDASAYATLTVTVDGVSTAVREYEVAYCGSPVQMAETQTEYGPSGTASTTTLSDVYGYQKMYVYVPEASASDQATAVLLRVNNAGWKPSMVSAGITDGTAYVSTSDSDAIGAALKAGYVIVSAGTRGRGLVDANGKYAGHSPACIVDTKAIIRYLRLNDSLMPGSAERIVLVGTSGGGGLTSAVAASGNSSDYYSYLAEIGAAGIAGSGSTATSTLKDDVFAAVAYCPINNLANADGGYEWQFNAVRTDSNTSSINSVAYTAGAQEAASAAIKDYFPTYLNGLSLTWENGALTSDVMQTAIKKHLKEEVERQLEAGTTVPAYGADFSVTSNGPGGSSTNTYTNTWLKWSGATVTDIDFTEFARFQGTISTLKSVPAFDACGVTGNTAVSGESSLFGESAYNYSNFTEWSWTNNAITGDGSGLDDTTYAWSTYLARSDNSLKNQIKMANPIPYLSSGSGATVAPYWYIRHGMLDRDSATAMQVLLYYAVKDNSAVKNVNFKLPYMTGHGGDYDVQEAMAWVKARVAAGN